MDFNSYFKAPRLELVSLIPEGHRRVLEIGCGAGEFRKNLNAHCEYWGVEPDERAAAVALPKAHRLLVGTYEQHHRALPDGYFDLVVCNDVIEHMADHERFLGAIKTKVSRDGYLIGSIPNVRYIGTLKRLLIDRDWKYIEGGVLDRTHLRFFTEKSLRRTLTECGYVLELFQGVNERPPKSDLMDRALYLLGKLVFGPDVQFLQFAFRVRPL